MKTKAPVNTARDLLVKARVAAQKFMPYLGSFIYSMRPVPREGIGTIAVDIDGNCYYDAEFIETLTTTQAAYVLLHEVMHLLLSHCHRFQRILPEFSQDERYTFNVAADLAVEHCLSGLRAHRPDNCIRIDGPCQKLGITNFEQDIDGIEPNMTVEEYFWLLNKYQEEQKKKPPEGQHAGGPGGSGTEQPSDDQPADDGPLDPNKSGSSSDGIPRDYELPHDDLCAKVKVESAMKDVEQAIKAHERANGKGSVPGGLKSAIAWRLRPTPDPWKQLSNIVANSVRSSVGAPTYTWMKFPRHYIPGGLRGKGVVHHNPQAVLVIDTSGSMMNDDTMNHCATVVAQGLRKVGRPMVICADTSVRDSKRISSLSQFEWVGGGGTSMGSVVEQVDKEHKPDAIILVTDGQTDWPSKPTRARLIIVLTENEPTPAWAKTIKVPARMKGGK